VRGGWLGVRSAAAAPARGQTARAGTVCGAARLGPPPAPPPHADRSRRPRPPGPRPPPPRSSGGSCWRPAPRTPTPSRRRAAPPGPPSRRPLARAAAPGSIGAPRSRCANARRRLGARAAAAVRARPWTAVYRAALLPPLYAPPLRSTRQAAPFLLEPGVAAGVLSEIRRQLGGASPPGQLLERAPHLALSCQAPGARARGDASVEHLRRVFGAGANGLVSPVSMGGSPWI
jgi:hypothetical protein